MNPRSNRFRATIICCIVCLLLSSFPHDRSVQAAPVQGPSAIVNPILFVTQVPIAADFTTIASTFGNHLPLISAVGRGGDLWIRYPDGSLKNLTATAGFGIASGLQGGENAIAVRDPAVYWSGTKALFSMVMGAPTEQFDTVDQNSRWQIYEITGLGKNDTPVISKVPNQPTAFNNISPIYGSDERIIFTTDRPRDGSAHLYPQLDEYDMAPTVTGVWSLDPATGDLQLLNHAPSGDFTPIVDSYGRLIFTQWDHLQRDQQADADEDDSLGDNQCNNFGNLYGTFNYSSESASAAYTLGVRSEVFPEPRSCRQDLLPGTGLQGHDFNQFFPWMINQDGSEGEILNHLGRHELHAYVPSAYDNDPNLIEYSGQFERFNPNSILNFFHIKEDPKVPGRYYGVDAPEFDTHSAGSLVSLDAPPTVNADHIQVTYVTRRAEADDPNQPGQFREPVPLSDGTLLAVHTADAGIEEGSGGTSSSYEFRIKVLTKGSDGYWSAGTPLTTGITKSVSYWSPDVLMTFEGTLWELNPVEVRSRAVPPVSKAPPIGAPEQQIIAQAGINLADLQSYLVQNNLALAVVRNVTERDDFDFQQPFNLRVPGGVESLNPSRPGTVYSVTTLQFFQGDQLRGLTGCCDTQPIAGRRVLAQYLHDPAAVQANATLPANVTTGQMQVASDGSVAAFVPAGRALTWQLTNAANDGLVRERYWITFQAGEIRTCPACHGPSEKDQMGNTTAATNAPQALLGLLQAWQSQQNPTSTSSIFLPVVVR